MTLADVASCCGGVLTPAAAASLAAGGMGIDSRRIAAGEIFVALPGAERDGHDYLPDAARAGAAAAVVARQQAAALPQIVVADARAALADWAALRRRRFGGVVAAVTGSNGKTTVKEMLLAICRAHYGVDAVSASCGNYNNALGAALTLSGLSAARRVLIAETGMDSPGELTELSALLRPHVAVINNAQRAHIGNFSSLADVARAKGELLSGLAKDGIAILNADDEYFDLWRQLAGERRVLSFGFGAAAEIRGEMREGRFFIGDSAVRLRVPGTHNCCNALAAAAAARALGASFSAIAAGLEAFDGVDGRLQMRKLAGGSLLIDDSYNANPDSAAAALEVLRRTAAENNLPPLLVFGDMSALGDSSEREHAALVAACADVHLFTLGDAFCRAVCTGSVGTPPPPCRHFDDAAALIEAVVTKLRGGACCVLVKGSRAMRMERVVQALSEEDGA